MLFLVCPAAEEHEVVRRMDSYCRRKDRPGTGMSTSAFDPPSRVSPVAGGCRA